MATRWLLLAGLALLAPALLLAVSPLQPSARRPSCPGGRFLVESRPLIDPGAAVEPLVISGSQVSIGRACPPVFARLGVAKRGRVKLSVTWPACTGVAGRARLTGTFAPDCGSISGTFVVRKSRIRKTFSARRSACGDGVLDRDGGEQCDDGAGCAPGEECASTCACVVPGQFPTTTTNTLPPISFSHQVQPIFTARCATSLCHAGRFPQQNLDLRAGRAYQGLVGVDSVQCSMKRVAPGSPAQSYLIAKLEGAGPCFTGGRMPPLPDDMATAAEVETVRSWIAEGAPEN